MKILVPLWIPTTHTTNVCCPKNYAMSPLCLRPWRETTGGYLIFHLIAPSSAHRRERESQAFKFLLKAEKLSRILFRNSKMLRRKQGFPKFVSIFSVSALLNSAPALRFECRWVPAAEVESVPNSPLPLRHLYRTHNIYGESGKPSQISLVT